MVNQEGSLIEEDSVHSMENREKTDKRIMNFFLVWFALSFLVALIVGIVLGPNRFDVIIIVLIVGIIGAFFLTGVLAFKYHYKGGIIPTKRVFKWFFKVSILTAPAFTIVLLIDRVVGIDDPDVYIGSSKFFIESIGLFIGMVLGVFCTVMMYLLIGFGMVGVLSVLIRRKTPDMLVEITKITPNITDDVKKKDKKKYNGYKWLGWVYGIPEALDSRTLTINNGEQKEKLSMPAFKSAVKWQILFGIILIIYISFSPFLWEFASMEELFAITCITTTFIPLFILPWFIYQRLDAKIKGPVKDFRLFDGLSSRMFQTVVAFGTLLLLIRMALRNPSFFKVVLNFLSYSVFFIGGVLIFTFVYFNYFEDDLAGDIARRYRDLKEENPKDTKT